MTKIIGTDNGSRKDTVVLMAKAIAEQMQQRGVSAFKLMQETPTLKPLISMSDYQCPFCGEPAIQVFSKKWLFFTLKRIAFYKCTNQHCPASKVAVYPEDISRALQAMEDTEDD